MKIFKQTGLAILLLTFFVTVWPQKKYFKNCSKETINVTIVEEQSEYSIQLSPNHRTRLSDNTIKKIEIDTLNGKGITLSEEDGINTTFGFSIEENNHLDRICVKFEMRPGASRRTNTILKWLFLNDSQKSKTYTA